MKQSKLLLLLSILFSALNIYAFAQDTLPTVTVVSLNYKYLKSAYDTTAAQPVRLLQHRAASYDVKNSDYYEEDYDNYFISFFIPKGEVLATYDNDGKILRTAERFKTVALPKVVVEAVTNRYPNWRITNDTYLVNYFSESNTTKKVYKLLLENGNKRIRVKTNEKGEFIE